MADPFIGLTLATIAGGLPYHFLIGLDVYPVTGHVYFIDTSTIYSPMFVAIALLIIYLN